MEGACAPVMPGRTLSRANAGQSFQAPWWVPAPYKERTFQRICGDPSKSHLSLQWLPDGQDQKILLTQGSKVALKRNGLVKAEIYGDHIRTWSKKGLSEDHGSLWYP